MVRLGAREISKHIGLLVSDHLMKDRRPEASRVLFKALIFFTGCGVAAFTLSLWTVAPVVELWTHGHVRVDQGVVFAMFAALLVTIPAQVALNALRFQDQQDGVATIQVVYIAASLAVSSVLGSIYGIVGVAAGFASCEALLLGARALHLCALRTGIPTASWARILFAGGAASALGIVLLYTTGFGASIAKTVLPS